MGDEIIHINAATALENGMLQIKGWHPVEEDIIEAQGWIDWLDQVRGTGARQFYFRAHTVKALLSVEADDELYISAVHRLKELCQESGCLPTSCTLPSDIIYEQDSVSSSDYSEVYRGEVDGQPSALKVLRLHDDIQATFMKARFIVRACRRIEH